MEHAEIIEDLEQLNKFFNLRCSNQFTVNNIDSFQFKRSLKFKRINEHKHLHEVMHRSQRELLASLAADFRELSKIHPDRWYEVCIIRADFIDCGDTIHLDGFAYVEELVEAKCWKFTEEELLDWLEFKNYDFELDENDEYKRVYYGK